MDSPTVVVMAKVCPSSGNRVGAQFRSARKSEWQLTNSATAVRAVIFNLFVYIPYSRRGLSSRIFFFTGSVTSLLALKMSMASTSLEASVWP